MTTLRAVLAVLAALVLVACGGDSGSPGEAPADDGQRFPDVVDVQVARNGDTYTFEVTISSPYDSPERYADGWRVKGADGTVYGDHTLITTTRTSSRSPGCRPVCGSPAASPR